MADDKNKAPEAENKNADAPEAAPDTPDKDKAPEAADGADVQKLLDKIEKTNREAKALRKRLKESEAEKSELEAFREADRKRKESEMSEAEKAAAKATELEDKLAAVTAELEATRREASVASAGALDTYKGFISYELSNALAADDSLDVAQWVADFKADNPQMFNGGGSDKAATPKTGEGGPAPTGAKGAGKAAELLATYKQVMGSSRPEHMQDRVFLAKEYKDLTGRDIRSDAYEG